MYNVTYYDDEFCCDEFDLDLVVENDLCDTYGGDYTSQDIYVCRKCKRVFIRYYGGRFNGIEEIYDQDDIDYYLNLND